MSDSAAGIFILLAIIIMVIGGFATGFVHNMDKLQFGVPWLKWLTLDEIVEMGHSRFWARLLLPKLHRKNQLEVRILDELSEKERAFAERYGFDFFTAEYYTFRLTTRSRGKRDLDKLQLLSPYPIPVVQRNSQQ
ncbi:MAG: hypothetical protein Q8L52_00115 [bacterium]|nr:hypothetical protein [bacterium]